jgi:hypothetical protein
MNASITDGPPKVPLLQQQLHRLQQLLDQSIPFVLYRWLALLALLIIYALRVFWIQGFYVVTYALGIYNLNLLLGFLTPLHLPDPDADGPSLPTKSNDEFRPFVRKLPEYKAWLASSKAFCVAFLATFFPVFDVPVFWPILVLYWCVLFFVTMKRQIAHMVKYKYVPFSFGKKKYGKSSGGRIPGDPSDK